MKQIKMVLVGIDQYQNELVTAHNALACVYRMYQRPLETNDEYMEQFKEYWTTGESAAGTNYMVPVIGQTSDKYMSMSDNEWKEATKAMYFILHADKIRFGDKI
mmetsp:Transcript_14036/g.20497  ORF Transcript_14036/g.20497 Transcript_14036/m.20497 type:complete len:104 (-) Transcript_14036:507-818(-)